MNFIATIDLQDQAQDIDQDQEPIDIQVSPPTTNPYYKAIIDEIMIYVTHYVEQPYISEDDAMQLEFYFETFVYDRPNFPSLVMNIIDKHHTYGLGNFNKYTGMNDDLKYIEDATSPYHMYDHLPEYIERLCDTYERLYGYRHERILGILACLEQMEDKVSPNLNQVIVNRDLDRYLLEFIN